MSSVITRLRYAVLPPGRRRVGWGTVLPPALFLAGYGGLCYGLEASRVLAFSRVWPFALLGLTPYLWWLWMAGADGLPRWRSMFALLTRLCLFGLLVMVLAEPRAVRSDDRTAVVYAVDLSGSLGAESTDRILKYVTRVGQAEKPRGDLAGLVFFGRDAAVQFPPRVELSAEHFKSIDIVVRRDGTDLARALSVSAAILPEEQTGRIVLVSDGVPTEGALPKVLSELKSRGIAVDVLPVGYSYEDEVWVERMDLPRNVKEGQTYEVSAVVSSLRAGKGRLTLSENGRSIFEKSVEYPAGKTRFTAPLHLRGPGYYEYEVRLTPETADHVAENNVALGSLFLAGKGRVLLVTDPRAVPESWEALVGAMGEAGLQVDRVSSYELSDSPLTLKSYDSVVFQNVPRDQFDPPQLQAVHDAVFEEGVGFLMVGGGQSFGPGGWNKSLIEEVLPVEMDVTNRKVMMNGALVLVIDHSGSMGEQVPGTGTSKQVLANHAAVAALRTLVARDWLGVVSFDDTATWVVPFGLNAKPEEAAQKVRGIGTGGGTNMYPALFAALESLEGLKEGEASVRHIILLTDGQSHGGDIRNFVERCTAGKISVTTIGVGHPDAVDGQLLNLIAQETKGRFFAATDARQLPQIMIREFNTLRKNAVRNEPFRPEFDFPSPVLKGIDAVPTLGGMVVTVPKGRAESVLAAPPIPGDDTRDPVLALYRYGTGRTAAFTSDLSPNWGREWVGWDRYQAFVSQLMAEIARASRDSHLELHTEVAGSEGVIEVESHAAGNELLDVQATVRGPRGSPQVVRLRQTGPRRYQARFPLDGEGRYVVTAVGSDQDRATDGFVVPYSQEYLRFASNPRTLGEIAAATGGRVLGGEETGEDLYAAPRRAKQSSRPVVGWFLAALVLLIPLDVGLRRIQLDPAALRAGLASLVRRLFGGTRTAPAATMSTLLERKQQVTRNLTRDTPPRPQPRQESSAAPPPRRPAPPPANTNAPPRPDKQPADKDTPQSTIEQLLTTLRRDRSKDGN